ncbi:MAG: 1,4-dihydroxy-2-naphthoate octaprenyltransferase [Muribaculaceae bacterium]|nr:1,4-dihydroxy-2-naphthoate octaprenyltransferase [Muribaculaceae bacterium]
MSRNCKAWIEALRLRTLPVSVAGVAGGVACALTYGSFRLLPMIVCLVFAVMAQIVSNFANEYYDFKHGLDRKGREGFRRGVTEGDITPKAMKRATYILLAITCAVGASLIIWGGWQLIFVGLLIAFFAIAYSAGPLPLSKIGMGDFAVIIFYGIVPVIFTCFLQTGNWENLSLTLPVGVALGLLADNVLIINNYRDMEDDTKVGKLTTVVIFGRKVMRFIYLLNSTLALAVIAIFFIISRNPLWIICWAVSEIFYIFVWLKLATLRGSALNGMLRLTALLMLAVCAAMITAAAT